MKVKCYYIKMKDSDVWDLYTEQRAVNVWVIAWALANPEKCEVREFEVDLN